MAPLKLVNEGMLGTEKSEVGPVNQAKNPYIHERLSSTVEDSLPI